MTLIIVHVDSDVKRMQDSPECRTLAVIPMGLHGCTHAASPAGMVVACPECMPFQGVAI